MTNRVFTVLSRPWCHLCHELIDALTPIAQQYGWHIKEIDIDQAPELEAQWDEQIPVLLADGVEICRHRLNTDAVHAFCQAKR
ncbi:MAG: glutaredoxin family protein [Azoarcus sp.]|jgi:thioredoxin reductase (NADPH)|nr:glutaredoxin family protein [Azoarcus sp.]